MVGSIIWNSYAFALVFLLVAVLGLLEFYRLLKSGGVNPFTFTGLMVAVPIYVLIALIANLKIPGYYVVMILPLLFIIPLTAVYKYDNSVFKNTIYTVFGIIYIIIPFAVLNLFFDPQLKKNPDQYMLLLGYFIIMWLNDSAAYLIGAWIGRNQLAKSVSPKKTWEGSIGGFIFGMATAISVYFVFRVYSLFDWVIIGLLVIVFGTFGDLFESLFKRNLGIKDTGRIIPGHGGILDRFDGILLSAPFIYLYIFLFIR